MIFHHNKEQEQLSQRSMEKVTNSDMYVNPIVTQITPLSIFYPAEDYHQNYYRINPNAPYCQFVIKPKCSRLDSVFIVFGADLEFLNEESTCSKHLMKSPHYVGVDKG